MSTDRAGIDRWRRISLLAAVAVAVLALDQVTKSLAVAHLRTHEIHIVGPIAFRLEYNSGIAFSIGTGLTGPIILVVLVLVGGVIWFARHVPTTAIAVGVGLILGGALGNLSDRVFRSHHGAVVDFLYTRYWPTFNVADSAVVCGCAIVGWQLFRSQASPKPESDEKS